MKPVGKSARTRGSGRGAVARKEKDDSPHPVNESCSTPPSKRRKSPPSSNTDKMLPFHPHSKWQEPDREDGLTLYEWHRKARPVLSGRIERPIDSVLQCFRCAICLETIRKAVVVECLHRFCEQCIEKALSAGPAAGQCPICRIPISSRRKLSRDPDFDRLVTSIVGGLCATEGPVNNMPSMAAATLQKAILRKRTEQSKSPVRDVTRLSRSEALVNGCLQDGVSMIDFALFRYNEDCLENSLDRLNFPYIRTQDTVTVSIIKVFLQRKLNLDSHLKLQLVSLEADSGKYIVLDDGLSLASIASSGSHDSSSEILELYYRLDPKRRTKN